MIVDLNYEKMTPDRAARELVYMHGEQLMCMGSDEWDHVVRPEQLTVKEEMRICDLISKHSLRVRRFLRV